MSATFGNDFNSLRGGVCNYYTVVEDGQRHGQIMRTQERV